MMDGFYQLQERKHGDEQRKRFVHDEKRMQISRDGSVDRVFK